MPRQLPVAIGEDGGLVFAWDDALAGLVELATPEAVHVDRASHVEPVREPGSAGWVADLSPIGGPRFGPFVHRGTALYRERVFLESEEGVALMLQHAARMAGTR